ncbi:MAG: peptidoglycan DD-metalloendopeptidase family protein, partial [Bacteroidota bacterium]
MSLLVRWGGAAGVLTMLASCGGSLAPVSDHSTSLRRPVSEYREVVAGDTLYSIAWESGRDYRDLAAWNNISPPYVIVPGQRINLYPPGGRAAEHQLLPASPSASPSFPSPPRAAVTEKPPSRGKATVEKSVAPPAASRPAAVAGAGPKQLSWTWPTPGKVLEGFSATGPNKGIDISGSRGQPVVAAAGGQVVYQGSGLRGYGQLIIIKHNADFLSAYAHCDKIYVKEGNVIKRGQKIADMGS